MLAYADGRENKAVAAELAITSLSLERLCGIVLILFLRLLRRSVESGGVRPSLRELAARINASLRLNSCDLRRYED